MNYVWCNYRFSYEDRLDSVYNNGVGIWYMGEDNIDLSIILIEERL